MGTSQQGITRPAIFEDASAIAMLAGELGYPVSIAAMSTRLEALLLRIDHAVFVAEQKSTVIGWIHVCEISSLESSPFAEIRGLVVAEAQRGRGVGAMLVRSAEQWATDKMYSKIRIRSNAIRTRTRQFYEKLAYAVTKQQNVFDKSL